VKKKLQDNDIRLAFVLDEGNHLTGRLLFEKPSKSKKEKFIYDPGPWIAERQNNLKETLSKMLETGEKQLPVVNRKKEFVGLIRLSDIFEEVNKK